jgi:hypothetical protein
MAEN